MSRKGYVSWTDAKWSVDRTRILVANPKELEKYLIKAAEYAYKVKLSLWNRRQELGLDKVNGKYTYPKAKSEEESAERNEIDTKYFCAHRAQSLNKLLLDCVRKIEDQKIRFYQGELNVPVLVNPLEFYLKNAKYLQGEQLTVSTIKYEKYVNQQYREYVVDKPQAVLRAISTGKLSSGDAVAQKTRVVLERGELFRQIKQHLREQRAATITITIQGGHAVPSGLKQSTEAQNRNLKISM